MPNAQTLREQGLFPCLARLLRSGGAGFQGAGCFGGGPGGTLSLLVFWNPRSETGLAMLPCWWKSLLVVSAV